MRFLRPRGVPIKVHPASGMAVRAAEKMHADMRAQRAHVVEERFKQVHDVAPRCNNSVAFVHRALKETAELDDLVLGSRATTVACTVAAGRLSKQWEHDVV